MIFITVGTIEIPFDRMIESCLDVLENSTEKIYIQHGNTVVMKKKKSIIYESFISNEAMLKKFKAARMVISAAGEATIYQILQHATCKPILFPRLQKYNEHVDDQQLLIARYFVRKKNAFCALNKNDLRLICNRLTNNPEYNIFQKEKVNTKIINQLIEFTNQS